ncbi:hypothetical protein TCDM_00318 [Trypanosoma cruzi Dm28c]|uniref:Uncharacterized protein n=1 Tax=Trypanosoma cruzi Dm28c TaxID=1416333 RepID=V5C247_TRYCR|nr:hypothetical protein TCDM_00318 [Trypanosoma cruzi Dm28c]
MKRRKDEGGLSLHACFCVCVCVCLIFFSFFSSFCAFMSLLFVVFLLTCGLMVRGGGRRIFAPGHRIAFVRGTGLRVVAFLFFPFFFYVCVFLFCFVFFLPVVVFYFSFFLSCWQFFPFFYSYRLTGTASLLRPAFFFFCLNFCARVFFCFCSRTVVEVPWIFV